MGAKISVLMSTYKNDNPTYLAIAIDSMLQQSLKPNEIIIVEDGPIPIKNQEVLDDYAKKYKNIILLKLKKNVGLGLALKEGLQICKNNIVARMDSDDISTPDRLEKEYKALIDQKVDIVGSNMAEFIESPEKIISKRIVPEKDAEIKRYLKTRCPMNHITVLFIKDSVLESGGYRDFPYNEDYDLWIRMSEKGKVFYNVQEILAKARVGKEMYSRRGGITYYKSEKRIQDYLRNKKIITLPTYIRNCTKRFIVQVLLPTKVREYVFKKFARSSNND